MTSVNLSPPRTIIDALYARMSQMHPALRRVAEYVVAHPEECKSLTISELADRVDVAESTVSRFVKAIDLQRYSDLRVALAEAVYRPTDADGEFADSAYIYEGVTGDDSVETIIDKVTFQGLNSLSQTRELLDPTIVDEAVDLIEGAGAIVLVGLGASAIAAEGAMFRFTRVGKRCLLHRDNSVQQMQAATVSPDDLVIGITNSGRTRLVVEALARSRARGAKTMAITSFHDSPVTEHADVVLLSVTAPASVGIPREDVTAKWGQMLALDIVYARYAARHVDTAIDRLEATRDAAISNTRL
jgi:RpiR family transcriptional regulator, carbohydrate utilization regulator